MESYKTRRRKYDIEEINELFEKNIELASHIDFDIDKCIHPTIKPWLQNYDHATSAHPLSLYYALMTAIAHLSIESVVLQWNRIPRHLNLYSIIVGCSGATKSGCIRECREALEELYDFLHINNIANPNLANSIIDKFTEAGFLDQLKQSTNIIIIQEELDIALKQMGFFSTNTQDSSRQLFCQLYDGLNMRKKTKGYSQRIRDARMTICGTSTGVLIPPILQEFLKHVMVDGAVVRCLFLVLSYRPYLREHHTDPNLTLPTLAQLLMAIYILGKRQYLYSEESQVKLDTYIERISQQATESDLPRITSFLAKQPAQITRITALTQVIDLLPSIFENIQILRERNDAIGLNIRLFNEIDSVIRRLYGPQITITESSVDRAIYFHGYLLEQTLKLFDITTLESIGPKSFRLSSFELKQSLMREILMLPQIIITKEDLYEQNDHKKIDRSLGTDGLQTLVSDGLLLNDYFVFTNTYRPIKCYAKVLPKDTIDANLIQIKLQRYKIQLTDYIDASRATGIRSSSTLTTIGRNLFSAEPYSKISDIAPVLSHSRSTNTLHRTTSSNTSIAIVPEASNDRLLDISDETDFSITQQITHVSRNSTVVKRRRIATNAIRQESDIADDTDILVANDFISEE
ncbi:unnamed protein product [Adineta ricciae]|uniref:DUF3987 domain-containing protein n=1 Tax=Adineta ricciae TaxID=249248 RepID=A0A814LP98_ADIRI|nr:unnamed protein product [Adineta ricciae]CAF1185891.1 unnamed protein product [Adineta ricciae]